MTGPIDHVVLLILENRSFDQMLGCLKSICPTLDGIDANAAPRSNADNDGTIYRQEPTTIRQLLMWDPHHETSHVLAQLDGHNSGFVRDFATAYPESTAEARAQIMAYYPLDFLPALHALARRFTVCDCWFSSLPGPTWPNRFFALSGTSSGRTDMPGDGVHGADVKGYFEQTQTTLFDRLNERAVHWKVYFHDIPQTTVLANQRQPHNAARYFYIDEFFDDARGREEEFPQFCLIEPDYMGYEQNDAHPPHDIMRTEKLIADVYNAIRANDALWKKTLLIVVFDEHGGFYDHVEPPRAVPPDDARTDYSFDRYGVRVPALLVSPWVPARVDSTVFDHTSVLKYLTEKWQLGPLGARAAEANSIGVALGQTACREVDLSRIELSPDQLRPPDPQAEDAAFGRLSTHQTALNLLGAYLKSEFFENAARPWPEISRIVIRPVTRLMVWLRDACQSALDTLSDTSRGFKVSIAEPDKLATDKDVTAKDQVARFIMRQKRWAATGIDKRIADSSLPLAQREHALQTLAMISKRPFDKEPSGERLNNAVKWLQTR